MKSERLRYIRDAVKSGHACQEYTGCCLYLSEALAAVEEQEAAIVEWRIVRKRLSEIEPVFEEMRAKLHAAEVEIAKEGDSTWGGLRHDAAQWQLRAEKAEEEIERLRVICDAYEAATFDRIGFLESVAKEVRKWLLHTSCTNPEWKGECSCSVVNACEYTERLRAALLACGPPEDK